MMPEQNDIDIDSTHESDRLLSIINSHLSPEHRKSNLDDFRVIDLARIIGRIHDKVYDYVDAKNIMDYRLEAMAEAVYRLTQTIAEVERKQRARLHKRLTAAEVTAKLRTIPSPDEIVSELGYADQTVFWSAIRFYQIDPKVGHAAIAQCRNDDGIVDWAKALSRLDYEPF